MRIPIMHPQDLNLVFTTVRQLDEPRDLPLVGSKSMC